ncbi:ABC transporter ATP-binding protein [Rhodophyticola sp. CCM32]|uniref:ABC transporter ATP-binding protein n=1 Tax=Rhodophyticola sp. CCM32 TaxID=2916397 RepID=UPI00143CC521|nr:ABC transporter ATP-binding protein [Rhodophyticola sp. CCM32]
MAMRPAISVALGAENLHKSYGPVQANRGISLALAPGEIHAIVGENGAGKSTLMRMLQGVEPPDRGHVIIDDAPVCLRGPRDALARGIGMVHQEFMMAPDLTLLENLVLGDEPVTRPRGPFSRIDWRAAETRGQELATRIGARIDWQRRTSGVPVHILQCVEIIRLLRRDCTVLILDEPTAVLAPPQVEDLFALLRNLRETGATILFISHKINEVMALADQVTVIRQGETVFQRPVARTSAGEIATHIMRDTGDALPAKARPKPPETEMVLETRGLSAPSLEKSQALQDISLTLHAGEILGLAGIAGNGQVELVECIAGLRGSHAGSIVFKGHDISHDTPLARRQQGLAYISADRKNEGLTPGASIETNVIAGSHRSPPIAKAGFLNRAAMRRVARDRLAALAVTYDRLRDTADSLSGGNQQKLVFARESAGQPALLIASQPTRGVDLNGIAAIHNVIRDFREAGGAVLLASEELDELQALSDRIIVLADGAVAGCVSDPQTGRAEIGRMMVGAAG